MARILEIDNAENFGSVVVEGEAISVLTEEVIVGSTLESSTITLTAGVSETCVLRSEICLSSTIE